VDLAPLDGGGVRYYGGPARCGSAARAGGAARWCSGVDLVAPPFCFGLGEWSRVGGPGQEIPPVTDGGWMNVSATDEGLRCLVILQSLDVNM
jgi:hypothetical protein